MRIGMLVDMYKPHVSGITTYVSLNKKVLEGLGHRVFVFTFGDQDYEDDELNVIRSAGLPLNINDTGFNMSFRYNQVAQRKVRSMDLIHVHHPFLSGTLALRYAGARGIPVVYTNHTRFDLYAQHYMPSFVPDAVGMAFLKTYLPGFCKRCDLVISPSAGIEVVMRDLGVESPISVIPNGVEIEPFRKPARRLTRAEVGLPDDATVLIYLGRLSPEKNLDTLLRAFLGVAAARGNVVLALVGDGPDGESLRQQAAESGLGDRVKFLGKVDYADVPAYYKLADAFVTASETEVHPLSLIEAMAAGLPALGMASPGVGDTIVDGINGLLSKPDLAAFTAKMMLLVMNTEARRTMAARAEADALQYDIHRTAAAVLQHYERLVAQAPGRVRRWPGFRQSVREFLS
jgi:glycosyltransferase involved in cell wall biosynthesis